jgi:ribonuclease Z
VRCRTVVEEVGALVLEDEEFRITGAPVEHLVPTMGLRIENRRSGRVLAYSSDTSPCDAMVALAQGATILIHEAAKNTLGHSSAAQAGEIARRAGAGRLALIHYRPAPWKYDRWLKEAAAAFGSPVELAQDFGEYVF